MRTESIRTLTSTLLAVVGLLGVFSADAQNGTWTTKQPMPDPPTFAAAGGVISDLWYVVGLSSRLLVYDPVADAWSLKSPARLSRAYMSAEVLNNKLYVVGGASNGDNNTTTSALEIYDPATDSWATGAPMSIARSGMASAVIGGKLFVAGGNAAYPYHAFHLLEIYDPQANSWSTGAPMPQAASYAAGAAINGKFYVAGGVSMNETPTFATLQIYDPVSDTWTTGAPMPTPRHLGAVAVMAGKLYVVSGHDGTMLVTNVDIYDPISNSWASGTPVPQPRYGPVAAVIGAQIFVTGGLSDDTSALQVYTPDFGFAGFLSPIGGADTTGGNFASPARTFKMGSTIPVKFTISSDGSPVLTGIHTLQAIKYSNATTFGSAIDATPQDGATTGNEFRLSDGEWHFNLATKTAGMSVGTWKLIATLSDGSQHSVWVQLK